MSRDEYSTIAIDVDNFLLSYKTDDHIAGIKSTLKEEFSVKGLRELSELICCLEIETDRKRDTRVVTMEQRAYIKRLTEKFGVRTARKCTHRRTAPRSWSSFRAREYFCQRLRIANKWEC